MRERIVVPSVRSPEVARAQRSGVRHRENALQSLDFGNGLLGVHSVPISDMSVAIVNGAAFQRPWLRDFQSIRQRPPPFRVERPR
jgi:hypothetical protein